MKVTRRQHTYTLIDAKGNVGYELHCISKCETKEQAIKENERIIKQNYRVLRFDHKHKVAHVVTFQQDDPREGYITPQFKDDKPKEDTNKFMLKELLFNSILDARERKKGKYYNPKNIHERRIKK